MWMRSSGGSNGTEMWKMKILVSLPSHTVPFPLVAIIKNTLHEISLHSKVFSSSGHIAGVFDKFLSKKEKKKADNLCFVTCDGKKCLINQQECITKTAAYVLHYLHRHCKVRNNCAYSSGDKRLIHRNLRRTG